MSKTNFTIHPDIKRALSKKEPILALESTILAHGMPFPHNYKFAKKAYRITAELGVVPAIIAIIDGEIKIGISPSELEFICKDTKIKKASLRDISAIISGKQSGATTVSATMYLAYLAGIHVFATGGIGGVHSNYDENLDISQDLKTLGNIPMIVISAGAKAILDLPKTLERLESLSVSVVGYKTKEFPAFYSAGSNLKLENTVVSVEEVIDQYRINQDLKINTSLLVVNPISKKDEIPADKVARSIESALRLAQEENITGKALTPFLLKTIMDNSDGEFLAANIALALNNIRLGSNISKQLT